MEKSGREPNLEDQNNRQILVKLEPAVEIEVSFLKFKIVETQYKTCLPKILFLTFKKIQTIVVFKYLHCSKFSKGYPP